MTRTKLADRILPDYTRGEEIANMVTHIIGAAFGVAALVLCVVKSALFHNSFAVVGAAIYGASLIILYTMSSVYHGLPQNMGKKVMQVLDHCTIYFLIAGTYTPITFCIIKNVSTPYGWTIFGIVWGLSAIGIIFTAIDHNKYSLFSMMCYLIIGWCIIFALKPTLAAIGIKGFLFILGGGICYSVGALLYKIASKNSGKKRYLHSIFHVFVLAGSILQFFGIFFYALK